MTRENADEVAPHVLVPTSIADRLKDLAKKTRVTQSEYLREAVADLLKKYEEQAANQGMREGDGTNG